MSASPSFPIRVRYAPSPTGFLHVGGARAALFNWLYARKHGGRLVLRIEDTDQARSTRESERRVISDLKSLGLDFQEGPEEGGDVGPYRQSERLALYGKYARELLDRGQAYYCFCPEEELTRKREIALKLGRIPHYDGTCLRIPPGDAAVRVARGEKAGLRFKSCSKDYVLDDQVRGQVEFKAGVVGDFFVTRSPGAGEKEIAAGIGFPVYNFCCVIDDHLMGITHVIRGEDHLSNTARQLMIYDAFGWALPVFAHTAMVLGADRQKLSKRNGDTSVKDYLDKGYLPEALINFLALLGWSPKGEIKPRSGHPEVFARDELIQAFSLEGLQKAPAVFDVQKLRWMNGFYMRMLPLEEIAARARPFFEAAPDRLDQHPQFQDIVASIRGEAHLLSELPETARKFFSAEPEVEAEAFVVLRAPENSAVIDAFAGEFARLAGAELTAEKVKEVEKRVAAATGAKGKALYMPLRALVTGRVHGPELKAVFPLLGIGTVNERIKSLRKRALHG